MPCSLALEPGQRNAGPVRRRLCSTQGGRHSTRVHCPWLGTLPSLKDTGDHDKNSSIIFFLLSGIVTKLFCPAPYLGREGPAQSLWEQQHYGVLYWEVEGQEERRAMSTPGELFCFYGKEDSICFPLGMEI